MEKHEKEPADQGCAADHYGDNQTERNEMVIEFAFFSVQEENKAE